MVEKVPIAPSNVYISHNGVAAGPQGALRF